jgi:hypothetical protein
MILMLSMSFCPGLSIMTSANPARPSIYIDPPNIRANITAVFSINVSISEITNLYSYELKLKYDSTLLNCTHAEIPPGTFLASNNNVTVQNGEIHQEEGYVGFAYALRAPEKPRNGSGVLGTITFQVSKKGKCKLELYDVILVEANANVQVIPPETYDVFHGYFVTPSKIYVDPPTVEAVVNGTFSINVSIADVTNLWACEFAFRFDNTLLNCTHAEIPSGHFLDSNGTYKVTDGEIHQDEGYVMFNATLTGLEEPRNGSGVLGTITFQVSKKGKCPLELYNITLMESFEGIREIPRDEYDVYDAYFYAYFLMRSRIYVDPTTIMVFVRGTFSINVSIVDITNLYGYELGLKYNSTLLNCTHAEIRPGHFLDSNDTYILKNGEIHQEEGYVWFAATLTGLEEPRNGSGVLGTITFQVSKKGECSLEIYDNMLMGYVDVISPGEYDVDHGYIAAPIDRYGDLNGDGVVNIADIVIVGLAYPSRPGDPNWNPIADMNSDGRINIIDAVLVAKEFRTKV